MTGEDALEFLMAGARTVQVGTALFAEPGAIARIAGELRGLMAELGISRVSDAVGSLVPIPAEVSYCPT